MRLPTFKPSVKAHGYVDDSVGEMCIGITETYPLHIPVSPYLPNNIVHPGTSQWEMARHLCLCDCEFCVQLADACAFVRRYLPRAGINTKRRPRFPLLGDLLQLLSMDARNPHLWENCCNCWAWRLICHLWGDCCNCLAYRLICLKLSGFFYPIGHTQPYEALGTTNHITTSKSNGISLGWDKPN